MIFLMMIHDDILVETITTCLHIIANSRKSKTLFLWVNVRSMSHINFNFINVGKCKNNNNQQSLKHSQL